MVVDMITEIVVYLSIVNPKLASYKSALLDTAFIWRK